MSGAGKKHAIHYQPAMSYRKFTDLKPDTDTQLTGLLVDITKGGLLKGEVKVGTHAF